MSGRLQLAVLVLMLAIVGVTEVARGGAQARTAKQSASSCRFSAATRVLAVSVAERAKMDGEPGPGIAVIAPDHRILTVLDQAGRIDCAGPTPTILNAESIVVTPARSGASVALGLDLRGGALRPGDTEEGDGSDEVELAAELGPAGELAIAFGDDPDYVTGGRVAAGAGLDLNANEINPDLDVLVDSVAVLRIDGGEGGGVIALGGGPGFDAPWSAPTTLAGGSGADLLVGGSATDILLGADGRDQMYGLGGHDLLSASGTGPDLLDCGLKRDLALAAGPGDLIRSCELRRKQLSPRGVRRYPRSLAQLSR